VLSLANITSVIRISQPDHRQGTFNVGDGPEDVAFDGANIWVTNYLSGTLSKL